LTVLSYWFSDVFKFGAKRGIYWFYDNVFLFLIRKKVVGTSTFLNIIGTKWRKKRENRRGIYANPHFTRSLERIEMFTKYSNSQFLKIQTFDNSKHSVIQSNCPFP